MKNIKKILILVGMVAVLLSTSNVSFAFSLFANKTGEVELNNFVDKNVDLETVTLDVPGMFCATCPFTVRKSLEKLSGISEVKTSLKTRTATVTYNPDKVTIKKMIKATTDVGYPSTINNKEFSRE